MNTNTNISRKSRIIFLLALAFLLTACDPVSVTNLKIDPIRPKSGAEQIFSPNASTYLIQKILSSVATKYGLEPESTVDTSRHCYGGEFVMCLFAEEYGASTIMIQDGIRVFHREKTKQAIKDLERLLREKGVEFRRT